MGLDREKALDELLVKEALRDIAARYSRAIDRRDPELLRSVYHDDAIDDHGVTFNGSAMVFVDQIFGLMQQFAITNHYITNSSYRVDGSRADGELYFIAYHLTAGEAPQHQIAGGRYLDNYECRDGAWKIAHRSLVWDSFVRVPSSADDLDILNSLGVRGTLEDDRSYSVLPLLGRGN